MRERGDYRFCERLRDLEWDTVRKRKRERESERKKES